MTRQNVFYIHVKAGTSSFLLISNILTELNIWLLIGQKCEIQSIFQGLKKSMFESKFNIYTIQKSADRKVFWLLAEKVWKNWAKRKVFWLFPEKVWKIGKIRD